MLEVNPGSHLRLRARGWPIGEAEVEITVRALGSETEIVIVEHPIAGPGVLVPDVINDVGLKWRNTETLRRLAFIVEGRPHLMSTAICSPRMIDQRRRRQSPTYEDSSAAPPNRTSAQCPKSAMWPSLLALVR